MNEKISSLDAFINGMADFMTAQVFQNLDFSGPVYASEFDGDAINTTFEEVPNNENN